MVSPQGQQQGGPRAGPCWAAPADGAQGTEPCQGPASAGQGGACALWAARDPPWGKRGPGDGRHTALPPPPHLPLPSALPGRRPSSSALSESSLEANLKVPLAQRLQIRGVSSPNAVGSLEALPRPVRGGQPSPREGGAHLQWLSIFQGELTLLSGEDPAVHSSWPPGLKASHALLLFPRP